MFNTIYHFFADPLVYPFMQRALLMALLVGTVCSVFSCFLVLKGWALMGDAVAHSVLPGLVIAYILGIPLIIGASVAGLFSTLTIGYLKRHSRIKEDAIMGIVFSGMFAVGIVILTRIHSDIHLTHILFGNLLGIHRIDFIQASIIALLCTAVMLLKRRDMMLYCFDSVYSHVIGFSIPLLYFTFLTLLSLTVVASLKAVGLMLVIAMLVAPGAIGFLVARSFDKMLMVAISSSLIASVLGTFISFHVDLATGPLIVTIETILFILALSFKKIFLLVRSS